MKKYLVRMECWQVKIFSKIISLISKRKVVQLSAIFFLGLIVLNGCKKKEDGIGLNVQPQGDQLNVELIDTASIITYSIKEDSLKSDELDGPSMLGTYVDPYFGKMDASIVSQIRLEASVDFTLASGSLDSLVIDSVIMYLALQGSFGNLDPQTFEVYQINEDIDIDSTYYTNKLMTTTGPNLAISGPITADPVSIGYVGGSLTDFAILNIPLSINDFGWNIFNESGNTSLSGNDGTGEFIDWYKGLVIKANNPTQAVNDGGIFYADMVNDFSKVTIFYRDTSGTSSEHDTLSFDFNFNANCAHYNAVDIDYSNTFVDAQFNDSTFGMDVFYLQALGGTKAKINFPNLTDFIDSGKVVVNKAELILPIQYNSLDNFTPSEYLFLTRVDENGDLSFLPDASESGHGGQLNLASKNYTFNITRYINNIFAGEILNEDLTLVIGGSGITANRVILNGANSLNKEKPKLVLTYTKY